MSRPPLLLIFASLFLVISSAHLIQISAGNKECFFEDLHVHDQLSVTYQVEGGGHLDIDFWLSDPEGQIIGKQNKQSTGSISLTADKDGRHEYCFSNQMSAIVDKMISFNVHGIIYVGEEASAVAPVEREIRALAHGLTAVKDEHEYVIFRERRHRNTAESTNTRVKWWSILQGVVLFTVVAWQVYYLKSFFEVKRII